MTQNPVRAAAPPSSPRLGALQQRLKDAREAADQAIDEYERVLSAHAASARE